MNVLVIGAGPAGIMAAVAAAENGNKVTLFERNERMARKILVTGKGRCNLTNNSDINTHMANVTGNGKFLYPSYNAFSAKDTMALFEKLGVPLKTERGNRVFPVSEKAMDIADALQKYARHKNIKIVNARISELILEQNAVVGIKTELGESFYGEHTVIATGGLSYPKTGSTGDGYTLAKQAGHTVTALKPSLTALIAHEGFCSHLQGLSLKNVSIKLMEEGKKKPLYSELGEMLFTHNGISGPLVLSASAHIKNLESKKYKVLIDLKPALDEQTLDKRILRDFEENQNKDFQNALSKLLPSSLIPVIVRLSGIEGSTKVNQISREQRMALVRLIKELSVTVTDFAPIEQAVVTKGGVSLKEIDPATLKSKVVNGLSFAGEVIDIDAYTGGFNLQIAFSTGHLAGKMC
ncbi:MAG: NAD(P)/FAD-dependent oxidoreductase [Clostridia bacterium]|nr:NAD(P)/FAD-dependent oxidoreductase [Clostridia bacterium]